MKWIRGVCLKPAGFVVLGLSIPVPTGWIESDDPLLECYGTSVMRYCIHLIL